MNSHAKLLKTSTVLSLCAIVLIIWSTIVWNLRGYDYRIWPGVVNLAAIGGWFLGWLVFTPSAVTAAVILLIHRRRQRNSK